MPMTPPFAVIPPASQGSRVTTPATRPASLIGATFTALDPMRTPRSSCVPLDHRTEWVSSARSVSTTPLPATWPELLIFEITRTCFQPEVAAWLVSLWPLE